MATSYILPFTPTDTGTNLLTQAAYLAASDRINGNQPGVASSKLNNKAMRQATLMAGGLAQFIADRQGTDVVDTLTTVQIAAMLASAASGRLIRTLVYLRIAGVQNVIIDGAAATTTGAGTYTPSANLAYALVEAWGGGGGGGGATLPAVGNVTLGSPGACGAGAMSRFTSATIGASQTITVGASGAGNNGAAGSVGGTSSFGALMTATGGTAGGILANQVPPAVSGNSAGNGATGANLWTSSGTAPALSVATGVAANGNFGGSGGSTRFGGGGSSPAGNNGGISASNIGSGGGGCVINNGYGGSAAGGTGGSGIIIIQEYAA